MLWRRIVPLFGIAAIAAAPVPAFAGIRVHPDGVNVNVNAATTVFLTFGGLTAAGGRGGVLVRRADSGGAASRPALRSGDDLRQSAGAVRPRDQQRQQRVHGHHVDSGVGRAARAAGRGSGQHVELLLRAPLRQRHRRAPTSSSW